MATATQSSYQKPGGVTLREASWLIHGEGERILQRDHEQVFLSINAFALKHVSFKEEHSMCLDRKRCICKTCIDFAQIFSCC